MNKKLSLYIVGIGLGLLFAAASYARSLEHSASQIRYAATKIDNSIVHTITIPQGSKLQVYPEVATKLQSIEKFAKESKAIAPRLANGEIAAINAGYFDPKNEKTTSYITRKSKLVADPRDNERLIENPDLQAYLNKILNRSEFRRYVCFRTVRYDITLHQAVIPSGCKLIDAIGAGPQILPQNTAFTEGFTDYRSGEKTRDAIATTQPNARSAVGITAKGDLVLAMVAQQPNISNSGMSLKQLSDFLTTLGVTKAMNLDGGSSASLYYNGKTFYGRLDSQGNQIKRSIKSVILVR